MKRLNGKKKQQHKLPGSEIPEVMSEPSGIKWITEDAMANTTLDVCFSDEKGEFTGWYWLGKPAQEEIDNTNGLSAIKGTEFTEHSKENSGT